MDEELKTEIGRALKEQVAVDVLWTWDALVHDASLGVAEGLTSIAAGSADSLGIDLKDGLKDAMQRLAKAQGEADLSADTAPGHLVTVLTQLLVDQLDHIDAQPLTPQGEWLAREPPGAAVGGFAARMNGLLLTAGVQAGYSPFLPGTVYRLTDPARFADSFGSEATTMLGLCCSSGPDSDKRREWLREARPILVEISPACDVAQRSRVNALLVGGVIVPSALGNSKKKGDAFVSLPTLHLRWSAPDFLAQDAILIFCHRYKVAFPAGAVPDWIEPWFRLREMPTASVRALHAGHAARIGYVLMADN